MILVMVMALTVPEIWQAGQLGDCALLEQYHRDAVEQFQADSTLENRLLLVLVDLYRVSLEEDPREALQEALQVLETAPERDSQADLLALLGNSYGIAIRFSSWFQAMSLGKRASWALHRALALNLHNPRAWLFWGLQAFYTPSLFGGGMERALKRFRQALELYGQEPPDPFWGKWGEDLALFYLAQTLHRLGRQDEAREVLHTCLKRYPKFRAAERLLQQWQGGKEP